MQIIHLEQIYSICDVRLPNEIFSLCSKYGFLQLQETIFLLQTNIKHKKSKKFTNDNKDNETDNQYGTQDM